MNSNQDISLVKNNEEDDVIFIEDEKTYPEPIFELKHFTINKDVYFDIEIAYLEGHPIVKTKTLKLYYHSDKPEDMSAGGTLARKFMMHGIREKFAVNLLNYLCRLINGFNLFHCYVHDEIKTSKEELKSYISHEYEDLQEEKNMSLNIVARTGYNAQTGKFSFLEGLLDNDNHIKEKLLNEYHDKRLPEVIPDLKHLHFIPIWTYVNPTLAKSKSAVHICHLGFLLERLVHNDNYPEFNNAAALALLNITNESDETALDVETINENKYKHMVERKSFYKKAYKEEKTAHAETQAKLNIVIDQNACLIKEVTSLHTENAQLMKVNQEQNKTIQDQSTKIDLLINMNVDQNDKIDTLIDVQYNTKGEINDLHEDIKYQSKTIQLMDKSIGWACHEIGHISMRQTITDATTDIIVLYTSMIKPIDKGRKPQAQDGEVWIASYVGDADNYKEPNIPEDAHELYRINANRLNSFKKMINAHEVQPFILNVYDRSMLINEDQLDDFIDAVDHVLNEEGQFKSIKHLEYMHNEIEKRKIERQRRKKHEEYIEFKRKVLATYQTPHIYLRARSRLVYIKEIEEEGRPSLIPLKDVDDEIAIKQKWWFRYGTDGINDEKLSKSSILSGKYSSIGDSRIKYED